MPSVPCSALQRQWAHALRYHAIARACETCERSACFSSPFRTRVVTGDAPRTIGSYRVLRTVARGGMGELYLAELDRGAGWTKRVALKTVLPHLSDHPEFVDRFIDEARIAGHLQHGNIVSVFDAGQADGQWFLAMEYVDGPDLRRVTKALRARGEKMPEPLALFVAAELCAALAYAHAAAGEDGSALGIVHRDVSPANVLLARTGEVKLTDFGIAAARDRLGDTRTGQLRGTFHYMSPEQAAGQRLDGRSDVFAVGASLFELLTGTRAFDGETDLEILAKVREGHRADLATLSPERSPEIVAIVERALEHAPAARYPSASAMRADLLDALRMGTGLVTRDELAAWLAERFPGDAGLGVDAAGPSLDDILNAQLDGGEGVSRDTGTRSRDRSSSSASQRVRPPSATGTLLQVGGPAHAERPSGRRGVHPAWWAALTVAALFAAVSWWQRPAPTVAVTVSSVPDGAEVFLDGRLLGETALSAEVAPGEYTLRLTRDGFVPWSESVQIAPGVPLVVERALAAEDRSVQFHSVPAGAMVTIDGRAPFPAGNTALVPVGRPVRLEMRLPGYAALEEELVFGLDEVIVTRALVPLASEPSAAPEEAPADASQPGATPPREAAAPVASRTTAVWRWPALPSDAVVWVDGERFDGDALERPSDAADVQIRIARPGFTVWEQTLSPRRGGQRLQPTWEPMGEPGVLLVRFGAEPLVGDVFIDGTPYGRTEQLQERYELPAGRYRIEVRNEARGRSDTGRIEVLAGGETTFSVDWVDG